MIPNRYRAGRTASPSPDECMVSITDDAPAVLVGRTAEEREVLEGQALTLARMARAQNVPVVINSFVARLFVRDLRPGSEAPVPKQPPVDRPPRYAQTDSRFRTTMEESGRANLVVLGVWARTPVVQPAIPALADVSEVYTASGAGTDGYTPGSSSNARVLPLLAAKLAPPVASPSLVPRPLLACRLNPEASTRLALLVAPAGSGKSSLVSQWRHDQEESDRTSGRRITWLSLDTADSDPARFLLYLCAALETVAPEAVGPVRALLQSSQPPSLQYALTLLLNALASLPQPVTVVLDDYHQIEANAVHESLTFLLEHLPPTLFFIITTRSDPPLPLARLRVRRQLIELRAGDLRFNDDEAATFLNESMGLSLAPRAVARLAERTEGWVAGLQLAALSLQGVAEPDRFLDAFTGSSRYVVDYLSEEVLRRQPPEVADFLRRTAILDRLCGPLCEAVTGAPGGQAMLERLEAANLFLIPLDAERRWYRYHHLFADVLRARLLPQLGEEAAALHERASAWLEAERMPADAIEHALSGGQYERAADLIERQCRTLWGLSAYASLEGWLKALPAGLIESRPQLSMALATLHYYYWRAPEAESVLDACRFDPCDESEESRDLRGRALALRGWAARLRGEGERAVGLLRQARELLAPGSHTFQAIAQLNLGILREAGGALDEAAQLCAGAVRDAQEGGHSDLRLRSSYGCGQIQEMRGSLREAEALYGEAIAYHHGLVSPHQPYAALALAGLGRLAYQRNDLKAAEAHLTRGLELSYSQSSGPRPMHSFACAFELRRVRTALGDHAAAETLREQMEAHAHSMRQPFLRPVLELLRVQREDAPPREVAAWLEAFEARPADGIAPGALLDHCLPDVRSREIVTWAQFRLAGSPSDQDAAPVVTRLEQYLDSMVRQGRHGSALEFRAFLATLHWQAGRRERALVVLEPALTLAKQEGYVRVFVEAGPKLVPLLRQAAARGIVPEYVGTLLAALGARTGAHSPIDGHAAPLSEPLSERELEVLRLLAAGLSNAEIAGQLFLSVGTVKQHVHHINGKLETTSRTSAVARARECGLL